MKIVHLCLGNFYVDNHTYQENLLPKAHKQLGYDVEIIAGTLGYDKSSCQENFRKIGNYINEYGIKVTRIPYLWNNKIGYILKCYKGTYNAIENSHPDILFIHNCQFIDLKIVVTYLKKHPNVKVFIDNHVDLNNSAKNWLSKNILHPIIWKYIVHKIEPYTSKFYGVIPARVKFLIDIYGLPKEKCELLEMGADDELIKKITSHNRSNLIREKYNISNSDFFIVTGGKINWARPETLNLMEAVKNLKNTNVKLIIFGSVSDELKNKFEELCQTPNIIFAGWLNTEDVHQLMASSDLVVFPGLHSVLWEQACALGIPCIFRDLEGVHHVDLDGNALFIKDVSTSSLLQIISKIIEDKKLYYSMKKIAKEKGIKRFSYLEIAKRSIQI